MRLRLKLVLIALVAAVFPIAGLRFVVQMEDILRQGEEHALLAQAHTVARAVISLDAELKRTADGTVPASAETNSAIFAQAIAHELTPDGYNEDWAKLVLAPQRFGTKADLPVDFIAARSQGALYLWFSIGDLTPVWADAFTAYPERSDHVLIQLDNASYRIACPGSGSAPLVPVDANQAALPNAFCQPRNRGYNVEVRLPLLRNYQTLGFRVVDFPVLGADLPRARSGTLDSNLSMRAVPILMASEPSEALAGLLPPGVRARVMSADGVVLRRAGSLDARANQSDAQLSFKRWLRAWVYRFSLAPPLADNAPFNFDLFTVRTELTQRAAQGVSGAVWRPAGSRASVLLAAAVPLAVTSNSAPSSVLLLERTNDALLIWSNSALGSLALGGLLTMLIAAAILLGYASWLSFRIRTLKTATENALTAEGILRGNFPRSRTIDEVGDLSRSFGKLLDQLGEYHEYLRTLAGKLSHELATPLAVVRSSLENLEHESLSTGARTYAERARGGAERLAQLLRTMSEATRMERAIAAAEGESFDLRAVIFGAAAAYRDIAGNKQIRCDLPNDPVSLFGAPELIHQALDKLVDNAMSFTPDNGLIIISLRVEDSLSYLSVSNSGPPLPEKMRGRIFDSLVSMRDGKAGSPHLGLGLYIVRLIADLHGGTASAADLPDGNGVIFTLKLSGMRAALDAKTKAIAKS